MEPALVKGRTTPVARLEARCRAALGRHLRAAVPGRRPSTAAAAYLARADLRRRWIQVVALAVLGGLAVGVSLAFLAGARRTASAYDRHLVASNASHVEVNPGQYDPETDAAMRALPGVEDLSMWVALTMVRVDGTRPSGARRRGPDDLHDRRPLLRHGPARDHRRAAARPAAAGRGGDQRARRPRRRGSRSGTPSATAGTTTTRRRGSRRPTTHPRCGCASSARWSPTRTSCPSRSTRSPGDAQPGDVLEGRGPRPARLPVVRGPPARRVRRRGGLRPQLAAGGGGSTTPRSGLRRGTTGGRPTSTSPPRCGTAPSGPCGPW